MNARLILVAMGIALAAWLSGHTMPVVQAQPPERPPEPLVDHVKKAIERGVQFLRDQEKGQGHWEHIIELSFQFPMKGGPTALTLLALLNAGVKPDDPIIERGLKFIRGVKNEKTYVVALSTMVYEAAGKDADRIRIQQNVEWLVKNRVRENGKLIGWTYAEGQTHLPDNSNTQYALLGLHAGKEAGAKIPDEVWTEIRDFYMQRQNGDGGWGYHRNSASTMTMTCAGLTSMYIAGMERSARVKCGEYRDNETLARALKWIVDHFRFEDINADSGTPRASFYNIYGIERVGRLSGQRFLGNHDWYREGCQVLVGLGKDGKLNPLAQKEDGSWYGTPNSFDRWKVVSTSFALLFLSRGRTPVLISKLKYGRGDDWNNDHHDARNLVRYARKELFKNQPLGWQIFAPRQTTMETENDILDVASELLQSPILYFNGHAAPELSANEIKLLQKYTENGGFIMVEACCGRPEFDQGFRQLIKKLYPDNELQPLAAEHPVWRAYHSISDFTTYPLEGIQQGCKTVLIYSRKDMSCVWEEGKWEEPQARLAFRLAGNIIAYATGLELPRPRLTPMEVLRAHADPKEVPRNFFQVAQLRHGGDWQPAPRAMRNLVTHLRETAGVDVVQRTETMAPQHPDFRNFKFLYMHGRNEFSYSERELKQLRAGLETGGLLLADACCGRPAFDKSFRAMASKLFPDAKLERIPLDDVLFSKELNGGQAIRLVKCRRENASGQGADKEIKDVPPFLEGIKHKGRWVVIYSKYDLGCALEKHQSPECLGHDYASAMRLASAAVLYAMMR